MKNILTFTLMSIFLLIFIAGNVNAFEFDNVKSYNSEIKEVTFKNSFLGIPLGEIGTAKLNTPQIYHVIPGKERKVAEFTINLTADNYENFLKSIELKNNNDGSPVLRDIIVRYKTYEDIEVPEYKSICTHHDYKNGSHQDLCPWTKFGSHIEKKEKWNELTEDNLQKGEISIGLFADVYPNDNIEWIPTLFGIKINEWAVWTDGLNTQLKAYYKFEDANESVYGVENITAIMPYANNITYGATGIIGHAGVLGPNTALIPHSNINTNQNNTWDFPSNTTWWNWIYLGYGSESGFYIVDSKYCSGSGWAIDYGTVSQLLEVEELGTAVIQYPIPLAEMEANPHLIVVMKNDSHVSLFVNNTLAGYQQNKGANSSCFFTIGNGGGATGYGGKNWTGWQDEMGLANRTMSISELDQIWNAGAGITYNGTYTPPTTEGNITVTLNSPVNYYNSSSQIITFNCSSNASGDYGILNQSLFIDEIRNYTIYNSSVGENLSFEISKTLAEGLHNWTCEAYGINNTNMTATARYLTIDSIHPQVNLTSIQNITYYDNYSTNVTKKIEINYTYSDVNIDSCWIYNGTANVSIACGTNLTLYLPYGSYQFTVYANDTFGNVNSSEISARWDYKIFQNVVSYNNETYEGSTELFTLNFSKSQDYYLSSISLNYNNSLYYPSFTQNANQVIFNNISVSSVNSDINLSFYWIFNFSDSSSSTSGIFNQSVINIQMDNCSNYHNFLFNYTLVDEETQIPLTESKIQAYLGIYDSTRTTLLENFSREYINENPAQICNNINLSNASYNFDSIIKYTSNQSSGYAIEYYNVINSTLYNASVVKNIKLYDLILNDSTDFKITFTDANSQPVENALIYIDREYILENNTFKTVELPKTDSSGQTIGHFVRNNIYYNLRVVKDGIVIGTFNNVLAFCQDINFWEIARFI